MADSAYVDKIAEGFPYWVGWMRSSGEYSSTINYNGLMLSRDPRDFPAQSRVRIYQGSKLMAEHYTVEMSWSSFMYVDLNQIMNSYGISELMDAFYEVSIVPVSEQQAFKRDYYEEAWGSVVSKDRRTAVNFPLLISMGAYPGMVDSTYLYYPGLFVDADYEPYLVVINYHNRPNRYDIHLYNADGSAQLSKNFTMAPKSLHRVRLTEIFQNLEEFFEKGPGMLVFHYEYKLNGYVQTMNRKTQILTGMDHLGLLFARKNEEEDINEENRTRMNEKRLEEPIICYCRAITTQGFQAMLQSGKNLESIQRETKAGLICQGCIPELEKVSGEEAKPRSYYAKCISQE